MADVALLYRARGRLLPAGTSTDFEARAHQALAFWGPSSPCMGDLWIPRGELKPEPTPWGPPSGRRCGRPLGCTPGGGWSHPDLKRGLPAPQQEVTSASHFGEQSWAARKVLHRCAASSQLLSG